MTDDTKIARCESCRISSAEDELTTIIEVSNDLYLCKDCVILLHENLILFADLVPKKASTGTELAVVTESIAKTPSAIVEYLSKYIIGQDDAKKTLALAAFHHYKKLNNTSKLNMKKSNVLLLGPTGSGKTALIEHLANALDIPFVIYDCTQLTETGYVGEDMGDVIGALYNNAGKDKAKTEKGIICLDEVDKLQKRNSNGKDVGGGGVQRMLLKSLETNTISIAKSGNNGRGNSLDAMIDIDTKGILFIASGAFVGLSEIVQERISPVGSMGFGAKVVSKEKGDVLFETTMKELELEDLIKFGMIPEFIGRFGMISHTKAVTKDIMKKILLEPTDSELLQIKYILALSNVKLNLSDEAIDRIAELAVEHKTGARAIKVILNKELKDLMYVAPDYTTAKDFTLDFNEGKFNLIENEAQHVSAFSLCRNI